MLNTALFWVLRNCGVPKKAAVFYSMTAGFINIS